MFRSNRRSMRLNHTYSSVLAFALTLIVALLSHAAQAQSGATTYSTTQRVFKVGVLLIDSTDTGDGRFQENPDPYIFYIADQRADLKPQGWAFVNPLAPATVTAAAKTRWDGRVGGNSGYTVGQKVTPNMATYWEVSLTDTPISQLLQYDLLWITNHKVTTFNDADREKMRKLVDAGGVIWLEDCGGMQIGPTTTTNGSPGTFFLSGLQFEGNSFGNFQTSGPAIYQSTHPLLNAPYALSVTEIANLGDKNYGNFHIATYLGGSNGQTGQANTSESMPNPDFLVNVVGNTGSPKDPITGQYLPYIAAGHYGSGSVILTSGDSGCDINDYCGGTGTASGGNSGAYAGTNLQTAHSEDLKFLYNCVNWGSANNGFRRNDRHTAASLETLNAPLLPQFNFASLYRAADRINTKTAPLLVNGLMFESGIDMNGDITVRSYDTHPFSDYDGDGNYDDGLVDASLGLPYDEIWRYTGSAATSGKGGVTEQPSSPVLATTPWVSGDATVLGTQTPTDKVFVGGPDGTLYIFQAAKNLGSGPIPPTVTPVIVKSDGGTSSYDPIATHGVAPSPTVYGELVYQVEPDGQVRAISVDPNSKTFGKVMWRSFDDGGAPSTIVPTATPTVGLSQYTARTQLAMNSGGNTNDVMLYVPAEVTPEGSTTVSGQILAYWLGTRNEVQGFLSNTDGMGSGSGTGSTALIDTRPAGGGNLPLAGALYVAPGPLQYSGSPFTPFAVRVYAGGLDTTATDPAKKYLTARQRYEAGIITTDYTGMAELNSNGFPTGKVIVTKTNASVGDPGLLSRNTSPNNADILVSVDYDVMYVTTLETPNKPPSYVGIGARIDGNLVFPNYLSKTQAGAAPTPASPLGMGTPGGGIDTMTFSPEDYLLFGVDQGIPSSTGGAPTSWVTSVEALHEQLNATTLLWRFGLHDPGAADGISDGQAIVDNAPIFNYNLMSISGGTYTIAATQPNVLPEYISGLKMVGSPITTNSGLTYVMATGMSTAATKTAGVNPYGLGQGPVTVLMAFQTNPSITLTLPISFDATASVQVSQVNALDPTTTVSALAANGDGSAQLAVDAQRGKITILNFNSSGGQFSASQSFVATVTPAGQTTNVRFVVHPLPPSASSATYLAGTGADATGTINPESGGYTPLQWYYVLPGTPTSSPSLVGDYVFFNMTPTVTPVGGGAPAPGANCVAAVDANPASNDAAVRVGYGEPVLNVSKHLHWLQPLLDLTGGTTVIAYGSPSGSQGTFATSSSIGAFAFEDEVTLIADGKRILETGPDGGASWTLDSTQLTNVQGGDLPIYGPNNNLLNADSNGNPPTGRTTILNQTLAHPTVSRKIGNGDYLIADSGNNRVMRVDRGGKITFKLDTIADPYKLMAGSDPKTLSGPTDVQYYIAPTIVGGNTVGYEVHYLVADPGNFRIVEVADYFDPKGTQTKPPYAYTGTYNDGDHSLVWITRTQSTQGQRLTYTNIQRFLGADPTNTYSGYPYVIATVGNSSVGGASSSGGADFTGGALVSLNYAPYATSLPVNLLSDGSSNVKMLWPVGATEPLANGTILASANDLRETTGSQTFGTAGSITPTSSSTTFNIRKLTHPAYFTELNLPNTASGGNSFRNIYLICDSSSVYAIEATTDTAGNAVRDVLWKFTQADYDVMNAKRFYQPATTPSSYPLPSNVDESELPRFVPASVKLLPNGDFLITNSFYGRSPLFKSGQFNGEVFQVTPMLTPGTIGSGQGATVNLSSGAFSLYTSSSSTVTAEGGVLDTFAAPQTAPVSVAGVFTGLFFQQMGTTGNTNLLEQPLFADRP